MIVSRRSISAAVIIVLGVLAVILGRVALVGASQDRRGGGVDAVADSGTSSAHAGDANVSFVTLDLHLDPHGTKLASWQVELVLPANATLVGVEGGAPDDARSLEPPAYDPRALADRRIILAQFVPPGENTTFIRKRTHIATLHVRSRGEINVRDIRRVLLAAGDSAGRRMDAALSLSKRPPLEDAIRRR